jgi:hypothetical protein
MTMRNEARVALLNLAQDMRDRGDPEMAEIIERAELQADDLPPRYRDDAPCPWGEIEHSTQYAEGILLVETSGHGGFILSRDRFEEMEPALRELSWTSDQFFEDDEAWAAVAATWPHLFKPDEVELAEEILEPLRPLLLECVRSRSRRAAAKSGRPSRRAAGGTEAGEPRAQRTLLEHVTEIRAQHGSMRKEAR